VTQDGRVLVVPRGDGRGMDIPTRAVGGGAVHPVLDSLVVDVLGDVRRTVLLGYVRNVVREPPDDYPWLAPDACFAVWHCPLPAVSGRGAGGRVARRGRRRDRAGGATLVATRRTSVLLTCQVGEPGAPPHGGRPSQPVMSVPTGTVSA
jgi:hypothetical protein